jgi:hypothetical protein
MDNPVIKFYRLSKAYNSLPKSHQQLDGPFSGESLRSTRVSSNRTHS